MDGNTHNQRHCQNLCVMADFYMITIIQQWTSTVILDASKKKKKAMEVNFSSRAVSELCVIARSTCSTSRWAASHSLLLGRKHQGRGFWERLIIPVKKDGCLVRAGHPLRQEQAGRIRTKVNSILDNTSQLSALWRGGRLKTPVRC